MVFGRFYLTEFTASSPLFFVTRLKTIKHTDLSRILVETVRVDVFVAAKSSHHDCCDEIRVHWTTDNRNTRRAGQYKHTRRAGQNKLSIYFNVRGRWPEPRQRKKTRRSSKSTRSDGYRGGYRRRASSLSANKPPPKRACYGSFCRTDRSYFFPRTPRDRCCDYCTVSSRVGRTLNDFDRDNGTRCAAETTIRLRFSGRRAQTLTAHPVSGSLF